MILERIINDFLPYIGIFIAVLLAALLWYYIFVVKPFANFPNERFEFTIPYWALKGKRIDIEILRVGIELAKKYEAEGLYVGWLGKPRVVVYGEEILKRVLPHTAIKPPHFRVAEFSFGEGIFISNGERWKKQRKMILPALHIKALKSYVSFMNNNAKVLVQKFSEKKGETIYDICHVFSQCTLRLFYETNFGVTDGDSEKVGKSVNIIHKTTEFFVYRFFRPWFRNNLWLALSPYARNIVKLDAENRKTLEQILENIKESVIARNQSKNTEEESDDLSNRPRTIGEIIIEDHLKDPIFTMEELTKEVYFIIFAGFDTVAHALMWIFYAIGRHPEVQKRVCDEIASVAGKEVIHYEDVQDLTYLDCVIKEALRMYTIPVLSRELTEDVQCGDYFLPKKTELMIFAFMAHRDKNVYPDPEKFNPDRFMDKNSRIKPWNFIPFMEGPRPCVGRNYAMLAMKIILIHVLRNFEVVSLDREEDLTLKIALILCTDKKPRMKFIPRHEKQSSLDQEK